MCIVIYMNATEIRNFLITRPGAPEMRLALKREGYPTYNPTKASLELALLNLMDERKALS
jgi:hypothetical protein